LRIRLTNTNLNGLLFDFGGTLDSDGGHWLDRFWGIYEHSGLNTISKDLIKEAFYWADAQLEADDTINTAGFRQMMNRHVQLQFEKLCLEDKTKCAEVSAAFYRPSERILHRNRNILETLSMAGFKMGVVSNFYGNVEALCREAGFMPFFKCVLDSIIVGKKKPDPAFFQLALEHLGLPVAHVGFVGDSFERDMIPAKKLGMTTFWMAGDRARQPPQAGIVDHTIYSLEDLPALVLQP
jgi:putative hydrolase of the HAD superfamily